ncbi:MAG: valine--pyruvate transaminase [Desulfofustis sp.]|nr:valine--pyruvate transaminase [Desulfofustis sp.]NNK55918.1 valine--pyruvate transaminase [Desulfofustis sp.]
MKLSRFGQKFTSGAGIISLMDDLGRALAGDDEMIMMGGGNPGHLPEFQKLVKQRLREIAECDLSIRDLAGVYDPPQGNLGFIKHCAALLKNEYGWEVGPDNICLTNGSQTGFFILFNMFGGTFEDGDSKRIRLPLTPEYIGYTDQGLEEDLFISNKPKIDLLDGQMFKYRVDFDNLDIGPETGAICVSRPTNPTGNVITDEEIEGLLELSRRHGVPLILDNAYGVPFPSIIFTQATPLWNESVIKCLSLSKLGLPAVRTGIIIAREDIIRAVSAMNAIISLAPSSFGPVLMEKLVSSGEILEISAKMIRPFYHDKCKRALAWVHRELEGLPYRVHTPEGSMFLWLWFENLPITSEELYLRLKEYGVLVVSGHYFFPGLNQDWKHSSECVRLTYSQDDETVRKGIAIIGRVLKDIYQETF